MNTAYIGLGSNLQQPVEQIRKALMALAQLPGTRLLADSGCFASTPMGPQDQPDYVNAVAQLATGLSPLSLLDGLQAIEHAQGRVRAQHWHARTLDLDLLLYADQVIEHPRLRVPHPGICQRDFVYLPLLKLQPDIRIPGLGGLREQIEAGGGGHYGAAYIGEVAAG